MTNKTERNFSYNIEYGQTPENYVVFLSKRYRDIRKSLTELNPGEWLKITVDVPDPKGLDAACSRIRAAVYSWVSSEKRAGSGRKVDTVSYTEKVSPRKAYVWVTMEGEPAKTKHLQEEMVSEEF